MVQLRGPLPYQKPPLGSRVDISDPLAPRRGGVWPLNEGGGSALTDALGQNGVSTISGATWVSSSEGSALRFSGAGEVLLPASVPNLTGDWTVAIRVRRGDTGVIDPLWSRWASTSSQRELFVYFTTSPMDHLQIDIPFIAAVMSSSNPITDTASYHTYVVTRLGSTWTLYIDGVLDTVATASNAQEPGPAPTLGHSPVPTQVSFLTGDINHCWCATRAYSAAEVAALHAAPFQMFLPPIYRRYLVVSGSPTTFNRSLSWSIAYAEAMTGKLLAERAITPTVSYSETVAVVRSAPRSLAWSVAYSQTIGRALVAGRSLAFSVAFAGTFARVLTALRSFSPSVAFALTLSSGGAVLARALAWAIAYTQALTGRYVGKRGIVPSVPYSQLLTARYTGVRAITPSTAFGLSLSRVRSVPASFLSSVASSLALARTYLGKAAIVPSIGFSVTFAYAGQPVPTPPRGGEYDLNTAAGTLGASVPPFHGVTLKPDLAVWLAAMQAVSGRYVQ